MTQETAVWLNQNVLIGFADRRGKAWHYRASAQGAEPNHYSAAVPVADVQRRLFAWHADELDVAKAVPVDLEQSTGIDSKGRPIVWVPETDRKAIAADDDYITLGHFKTGYRVHQYDEWLLDNIATLLDDNLSISSAGLLRNRAVAWVEVGVPDTITTPEGVAFRPNLLAATSMDGSLSTTFKRTVTATVCDNTMGAALREQGHQIKFRHSKNSIGRITDARVALDIVHTMAADFEAEVRILTNETVTDAQWAAVLDRLVPVEADTSKRSVTLAQQKRGQLEQLYRQDERVAPWAGTAFGVLQAFSTFHAHVMPTRGETIRAERNMMAALDGTTERQDREVLAAVGLGADRSLGVGLGGLL